jgi:LPS-assembly lipoprotein
MWSLENTTIWRRFAAVVVALGVSGLLTGCFQPLYGEYSPNGGPSVASALRGVEVLPIDAPNGTPTARLGVEIRNALLFDLTGGSGGTTPTHRLKINISPVRQQVIVDVTTARPDVENYGIDAGYSLTDLRTNKVVVSGRTFARVSYDIPGQEQRFAAARGLRDAENRAAKVIADQIHSRLTSFFVTGS